MKSEPGLVLNPIDKVISQKTKTNIKSRVNTKRDFQLLILALPVLLYVFIFCYLPMAGVVIAFEDYRYDKGVFGSEFIGFKNFEFFFKSDSAFTVTFNTLAYNLTFIVIGTLLSISVALLLNEVKNKSAIKIYQTSMFLPYFFSWVVVSFIVYAFISPSYGMGNYFIASLGIDTTNLYFYPPIWPFIILFVGEWKYLGYSVIINYTVLMGIDSSYYEAAEVDGASKLQRAWHISVPFLVPITIIQIIMAVGRIFSSDFGLFYQVTRDSSMLYSVTDVIDTYIFRAIMNPSNSDVGMGAAIGLFQSCVGFVLVVVTNTIVNKVNSEAALY